MKNALIGLVVVGWGLISFGIGAYATDSRFTAEHNRNVQAVVDFATKAGCIDLGEVRPDHPMAKYTAKGFNCGGATIIITK